MDIKEQIKADRLQARKDRNEKVSGVLGYILGQIDLQEKAPNAKGDISLAVIKSHTKAMKEVATNQAGTEAAVNAQSEIDLLKKYLPAEVDQAELEAFIAETVTNNVGNRGVIMKAIKEKYGDGVDMKLASQIVAKLS